MDVMDAGIVARTAALQARKAMADDTDHDMYCVVPNRVVKRLCEAIETLSQQGRTILPVEIHSVYHNALSFSEHTQARKDALAAGDQTLASRQAGEAANAWQRMIDALGM